MDSRDLIKNHIDSLVKLVCSTSLWASKEVVKELFKEEDNITASWYMNTRRFNPGNSEARRTFVNGIYLDDNVCANIAIKKAVGVDKPKNFTTCHIYDRSTYHSNFHTSIPNLILVPNTLYALTDNLEECKDFLKYIAYNRYGFFIDKIPEVPKDWSDDILDTILTPSIDQINRAIKSVKRRNRKKLPKE